MAKTSKKTLSARVSPYGHTHSFKQYRHMSRHQITPTSCVTRIIKAGVTVQRRRTNSPTPTSPLAYIPFVEPLWISHMYILIYVHSVIHHLYETQARFESGHKTDWSHVNCQTQMQVLDHKCYIRYCCFKSQANLPPAFLSGAFHSDLVSICNKREQQRELSQCRR